MSRRIEFVIPCRIILLGFQSFGVENGNTQLLSERFRSRKNNPWQAAAYARWLTPRGATKPRAKQEWRSMKSGCGKGGTTT